MASIGCAQKKKAKSGPFHLSQKVDYGLFLLSALAQENDAPASIRTIAQNGKLSFSFLQKIAHALKRAGIVRAARGKVGGYSLNRTAQSISLKDIIEALDGKINLTHCFTDADEKHACPRQKFCSVRTNLRRINDEIADHYYSKKLSEFISQS